MKTTRQGLRDLSEIAPARTPEGLNRVRAEGINVERSRGTIERREARMYGESVNATKTNPPPSLEDAMDLDMDEDLRELSRRIDPCPSKMC